jgi:hypothetical protein
LVFKPFVQQRPSDLQVPEFAVGNDRVALGIERLDVAPQGVRRRYVFSDTLSFGLGNHGKVCPYQLPFLRNL